MKEKIENLQQFFDWVENSDCRVFDKEDDNFTIEAPNNTTWQIQFEEDNEIEGIISKTIEQLEEFDADERFTEFWCADFAKHNGFTPLQFINMLKEDEETFRYLARELRKITN
jgi:hypothetical protein